MNLCEFVWGMILGIFLGFVAVLFTITHYDVKMQELCEKLLNYYCPANGVVLDPFMGTGTTAVACKKMNLDFIGYEISQKQVDYAEERLKNDTRT